MDKVFYSPGERGFFHEVDFGPREITRVQEGWVRPTITVTLKPGETFDMGPHLPPLVNAEDVEITVTDVPDMSVEAPTETVPNPDCRIPADAIEVTPEQHRALVAGQGSDRAIAVVDGEVVLVDVTPSDEELAARARAERDRLLAESDWVTLRALDTGEPVPQAWQEYRQALRDISSQAGFPHEVDWPPLPG